MATITNIFRALFLWNYKICSENAKLLNFQLVNYFFNDFIIFIELTYMTDLSLSKQITSI